MKNIKKLLAVLLAALLCVSVTACANNSASSTAVATLETSSTASEGETAESTDKDPAGYDDDIQGLCKYLEDCKVAAGEKVQMSYDVIGAENGYKYVYRYADSAVQLEVYEFPAELQYVCGRKGKIKIIGGGKACAFPSLVLSYFKKSAAVRHK